jgi:subtilisin family serine protease
VVNLRFEQDRPELEIDLPDSARAIDTSDVALIEAVRGAGGRVFIGLKASTTDKLTDATFERDGKRRARISSMSATAAEAARIRLEALGVRTRRAFGRWGTLAAEINPDSAGILRADRNVLFLEPIESVIEHAPMGATRRHVNTVAGGQTVPANITQVRATDANLITTGDGVDVVIMDSGIEKEDDDCGPNFLHEDIDNSATEENLIWFEVEGGISQGHCRDARGHGTAVAGVLLATNNMIGVRGVAPFVTRHHNLKVLDPVVPGGPAVGDADEIAAALELVPDDAVVNMSISGPFSAAVATALADLYDNHDVVLVASAGNVPRGWGSSTVTFPATDTHVIAVSGVTPNDQRAVNVTGTGPPLCEGRRRLLHRL